MSRYAMENPLEAERLESKTDAAAALEQLELVGLAPGMTVLDAGSGTGAVARAIAGRVGPTGRVVALDGSSQRSATGAVLASSVRTPLAFVAGDVTMPPLREGTFDLVWSRFLFGYLADPDRALLRLAALARPGGKVAIGEVDGHGLFHWPLPPRVAEGLPRFEAALRGVFDPYAGRKLYHRFRRARLDAVKVHVLPYHVLADELTEPQRFNWQLKLQTLRPLGVKALGGEAAYDAFAGEYLAMLGDPDTLTYSVLHLVEGVRGSAFEQASA
jgi:ubiquinone/menaquinone biosynthesis C-methylase UbiE